jgi:hypothetical protein
MIECRQCLRLALETAPSFGIGTEMTGHEFQRHLAVELIVCGQIDFTHPASAELGGDFVLADGLANHQKTTSPFSISA